MSGDGHHYQATCSWTGSTAVGYAAYDRSHEATAPPSDARLRLSADSGFLGDPGLLNPESLLVISASSCQLLSFLALAARARLNVTEYVDQAEAFMSEHEHPVRLNQIRLRPRIRVHAPATVERVSRLCQLAHRECYIANSLRTEIVVSPDITVVP